MWFTRISIGNPVLATMLMAALLVLGLFSYQRLRIDQFPDIAFPVVVIQTDYPGAAPETIESDISRKIEGAVNSINGIKRLTSRSLEGSSLVVIEFELSVDAAQAAQDVREKIAAVKVNFRREVKEPRVTRYDPADAPIISYAVTSDGTLPARELTAYADQVIKRRLENVRGVGSVNLVGGVARQVQIELVPERLEALALGVDQVLNAVRNENQELPAGTLRSRDREQVVQVAGRIKAPADFARIVVARRGGQPVILGDVARLVDGQEERNSLALLDGRETLALSVLKAQGQNTIDVVDELTRTLRALERELPPGVRISTVRDASLSIRNSVANVRETIVEGALLTVLIVFLFLNSWRSTVITGLTLPIALIGTFLFMYMFGFTINMLTLMALSLCVGLLIDDAIVVRENIMRHASMRVAGVWKDHRAAALDGTAEIGLAVLATTLSIVAVFLPVGFMGGIIGRFFHQFGVTVVAAVLISMFVSFTLDPMLSSVWPDPREPVPPRTRAGRLLQGFLRGFERAMDSLSGLYQRLLAWALRHRPATMLGAVAVFAGSLLLAPLLGTEFVPNADYSETMVNFQTPVGSSLELTQAKARQVDAALRANPEVRTVFTTINTGTQAGKHMAEMYVRLTPRSQRSRGQTELTRVFRERLAQIAGITVTHVGPPAPVGNTKILFLSLQGPDLAELERLSAQVTERFARIPGLVDLDTSLKPGRPTVAVELRRDLAADLGIGVAQVGNALRPLLAGEAASTWRAPNDENHDVVVRLAPADRDALSDLGRLMLASNQTGPDGAPRMVALRQIADLRATTGPSQINRADLTREVQVTANPYGRGAGEISRDMQAVLDGLSFKPGYRAVFGGSTRDMNESAGFAAIALALAVIFIYMILAAQFRSFVQPIALMAALPLTLVGVFLALLAFGSTLNLFSVIGFVMLMGLVTKNAILLVDYANQARRGEHGAVLDREAALLEAARVRLRPILMTTLAMVFGMLPLALSLSEGAEQRSPLGQAVIGGVITSSLLTLVVVPVAYTLLDDLAGWLTGRRAPALATPATAEAPAAAQPNATGGNAVAVAVTHVTPGPVAGATGAEAAGTGPGAQQRPS